MLVGRRSVRIFSQQLLNCAQVPWIKDSVEHYFGGAW